MDSVDSRLFNKKTLDNYIRNAPIPEKHLKILQAWISMIQDGTILRLNERELQSEFNSKIIQEVLGYRGVGSAGEYTVAHEYNKAGRGVVDLALGRFGQGGGGDEVIAVLELKRPSMRNLDAIMQGRNKTPVQQAWEYACSIRGIKWVMVTNYLELRLYAFGESDSVYESFHFKNLANPCEYSRLMVLLSEESMLSNKPLTILHKSRDQDKEISAELYREYKTLRHKLIQVIQKSNRSISKEQSIGGAQKILDRILFIAFAEDRGILPEKTLKQACQKVRFSQNSIWDNFRILFNWINVGNRDEGIFAYNGGLFGPDPVIEKLRLPDDVCESFKVLGSYDYGSEVSVTILGHIFEQSVNDLEGLREDVQNNDKTQMARQGQRRREGVIYTPDHIARFIVEETVGKHLEEIFAEIVAACSKHAKARSKAKEFKTSEGLLINLGKKAELKIWREYRKRIKTLRIVDPACGSGVFLIMAFEHMNKELNRVNDKIAALENKKHIDSILVPDREILTKNLFGVDVNPQSADIARLSLWIKTARYEEALDNLSSNILVGDSLIKDNEQAYQGKGFDWEKEFPSVFNEESGGFDIVLGNPPYVKQELIADRKAYLKKQYEVADGKADLYCYFYEKGLKLLKPGGRLGFISSKTFMVSGFGKSLREYLLREACLEAVVDLGTTQVFEGATTYTAITVMKRGKPGPGHSLNFWKADKPIDSNFLASWNEYREALSQESLHGEAWVIDDANLGKLIEKITEGCPTLKDVYGSPLYGIKTGCNKAFIVSEEEKQMLCAEDPRSMDLLAPVLTGQENERWRAEWSGQWLIYISDDQVDIKKYPAIYKWLMKSEGDLRKRKGKQDWFVIQNPQKDYRDRLNKPKICISSIGKTPRVYLEQGRFYLLNSCYFLSCTDHCLVAYLNSRLVWFLCSKWCSKIRGDYMQFYGTKLEVLPIPSWTEDAKSHLAELSKEAHAKGADLWRLRSSLIRQISDLLGRNPRPKLTKKLKEWWLLNGYEEFYDEVKKTRKRPLLPEESDEWADRIRQGRTEHDRICGEIASIEAKIDRIVYDLFKLTQDEIRLLEKSIK